MLLKVVVANNVEGFEERLKNAVEEFSKPNMGPGQIEIIPMGVTTDSNFYPREVYVAIVTKRGK